MRFKIVKIIVFLAVALFIAGLWKYFWQGVSTSNPRVSLRALQGFTPDQVTAQLGPARQDPRHPDPRLRTPSTTYVDPFLSEGTFDMEYSDLEVRSSFFDPHFGHFYSIRFEKGHVVDVIGNGGVKLK